VDGIPERGPRPSSRRCRPPSGAFEALDPVWRVPKGYAVINPDPRGTWYSEGRATYLSPGEAQDC
jgi:predicted acyl esterase